MASGGGNNFNRRKDVQKDDPSIVEFSNSYPGTSKLRKTVRQPSNYSDGPQAGREDPRYSNRRNQQQNSPASSEKRQKEHWKVPSNGQNGSLARDLFGAPNPDFRFDFQAPQGGGQRYHDTGYNYGGKQHPKKQFLGGNRGNNYAKGGRSKANYNPQMQGHDPHRQGHEPHRQGHEPNRQGHDPTRQGQAPKSAGTADKTPKGHQVHTTVSEPNIGAGASQGGPMDTRTQRNTQYIEMLMKNGQKTKDLRITLDNKPDAQRHVDVASTPPDPQTGRKTPDSTVRRNKARQSSQSEDKAEDQIGPTDEDPAIEKKKKRKRERKKKKEKKAQERQTANETGSQVSPQPESGEKDTPVDEVATKTAGSPSSKKSEKEKQQKNPLSVYANPLVDEAQAEKVKKEEKEQKKVSEKEENNSEKAQTPTSGQNEESKKLQELGLKQAEKRLEKDMIFKLEKKSPGFPDAQYFCQLCSHHLNTIQFAHKHLKDKRHKKEFKNKQQDELLKRLKRPPEEALAALERVLEDVIAEKMLSEDGARARQEVVEKLAGMVRSKLPECDIAMYGSSASMIGLKTSDVNVDIQFPETMKTPEVLLSLLDLLKKSEQFTDVQEFFDAKVPRIELTDPATNIQCSLSACNMKALHTTRLLRIYGQIEPSVIKLANLLRLWGHYCQVDRQHEGSLPPHSFVLMTIFYLQQKQNLPVLHEIMAEHDIESLLDEAGDDHTCLEKREDGWWYCPTVPPSDGKKEMKGKEAEDEEDVEDVADYTDSDDDIDITFSESPKEPKTPDAKKRLSDVSLDPVKLGRCFDGKQPSLAELWLDILKFYSADFDMENLVITIRSSSRVTRTDRSWSHRRIAVEDPCSPKWNLCKPMNSQALFTYFMTRLKHSVFYFHTAHESSKNKNDENKKNQHVKTGGTKKNLDTKKDGVKNNAVKTPHELASTILKSALEEMKGQPPCSDEQDEVEGQISHPDEQAGASNLDTSTYDITQKISHYADAVVTDIIKSLQKVSLEDEAKPAEQSETPQVEDVPVKISYDSCYKFTKLSLMDGKVPVTVCCLCKKEGHTKKNCPDEVKVKVEPLPPMTSRLRAMLDAVCREMYETYVPKEEEVTMRERVCSGLLEYLRLNYNKDVKLCLFGSSRNRFTFKGSDLDICMTFEGNETGEGLDFAQVIEELAKVLRKDPALRQIIPITTAKVPIVKFYHPQSQLEGDISLYNLLAQRNTSMLALYATIDERCRVLGYAMKAFVKRCCIGDASRGSLSSYAYTLLVIYFLQQRDPPVLPVLQELYKGQKSPEHIVDGWNSWFYDNLGNLPEVWPEFGKNKETVGELWLGLLRFYTEDFNFRQNVACIRQKRILTAFEKEWTSKCICIEDPFDRNHNLGAGVSRKMTNFIMSVFIKARERFGTEPKINGLFDYPNYFFNADILMDGQEVPNDRCCRICGKIGHFVKDCPKRRTRGKKNGDPDGKLREVDCFACGKKGHFKKDCPDTRQQVYGSPTKNPGMYPDSPRRPMHMAVLPHPPFHRVSLPPPMQNPQGSPVVVHAKRHEAMHMKFPDSKPQNFNQNYQTNGANNQMKKENKNTGRNQQSTPQGKRNRNEPSPSMERTPDVQRGNKPPQGHNMRQQRQGPHSPFPSSGTTQPNQAMQGMRQQRQPGPHSPFPSGGPTQPNQAMQSSNSKVNRNLASDFGKNLISERNLSQSPQGRPSKPSPVPSQTPTGSKPPLSTSAPSPRTALPSPMGKKAMPVTPNPSHTTPHPSSTGSRQSTATSNQSRSARHGLTLKDTSIALGNKTKKETPSPLMMPTVAEIESQMMRQDAQKKKDVKPEKNRQNVSQNARQHTTSNPQAGDKINHLIPRNGNKEDGRRNINGGPPAYAHFAHTPPFPMSPPQNLFGGHYAPHFSTSPRGSQHTPNSDRPYFRSNNGAPVPHTPPTPTAQPMRSPGGPSFHMGAMSPPGAFGHSYPPPATRSGYDAGFSGPDPQRPQPGPIMSEVFTNLRDKQPQSQREVFYAPTMMSDPSYYNYGAGGMYRSYPPNNAPPGHPQGRPPHWGNPYPRK